jgi:hypothetical protein
MAKRNFASKTELLPPLIGEGEADVAFVLGVDSAPGFSQAAMAL